MYKIAIAGASTLLGKELKDAVSESTLAAATFTLLDEDESLGQLDQVGDEITFVQAIDRDSFEHVDFTFFCGSEGLTHRHWREALNAGSTVIDLSAALDHEPAVLIRAPWFESDSAAPDLFTPAELGQKNSYYPNDVGSKLTLVNVSGGRATARAIRGARLMVIEGMGHDLPEGAWPQIVDGITEHVREAQPLVARDASRSSP